MYMTKRLTTTRLQSKWSPALKIQTVLLSIQALMSAPNPDDPLDNTIADLWKSNEPEALERGVCMVWVLTPTFHDLPSPSECVSVSVSVCVFQCACLMGVGVDFPDSLANCVTCTPSHTARECTRQYAMK